MTERQLVLDGMPERQAGQEFSLVGGEKPGTLSAVVGGRQVPLSDCEWVMFTRCGCPVACMYAALRDGTVLAASEGQAWLEFFDEDPAAVAAAKSRGNRVEAMTREQWSAEVMNRMGCVHA